MNLLLAYLYFMLILGALLTNGFGGFLLKLLVAVIAIYLILLLNEDIKFKRGKTKHQIEWKKQQIEQRKIVNQRKQLTKLIRDTKKSVQKSGQFKLPISDKQIKKTDKKAKYIMKTLKYVKKNEPKFFGRNYSKVYTKDKAYNESIKEQLIKVFGKVCCYCGLKLFVKELTLDHVMPREKGGSNRVANILFSCRKCNSMKGAKNIGKFIIDEYTAGEDLAPWFISVLENKTGRNLLKALN
jgi:hypothetical protein